MNYQHSPEDYKALADLGIPNASMNGYQVTDGDEQALRELYSNRLEQGFEVPEEYMGVGCSRKERELKYQELSMFTVEGERIDRENIDTMSRWERNGYEDSELEYDDTEEDYVPEWLYNLRRQEERAEEKHLEIQRKWSKKRRNDESSKKLVTMLNKREDEIEENRRKNIEKSKRIVENMKKTSIA